MAFQLECDPGGDRARESSSRLQPTGSEDAWRALVDRFAPLVHGVARSFRLPRDEAEDVSQTVWLRLVEHLERLREPDRVGAWLASTTRHECLRTLRLAKTPRAARRLRASPEPR